MLIILSALVMVASAQRGSYAGSGPIGRPGLASRFKDDNDSSSTTVSLVNRVGEDGSTPKIPVDARGDVDLVNTLNTWEREHQPFWLLNSDHIEKQRNTTRNGQQNTNRNTQTVQGSQANSGSQSSSNVPTDISNRGGSIGSTNQRNPTGNNRNWLLSQGSSNVPKDLPSRGGSIGSVNQRNPGNDKNRLFGRPTQGDIKPVYETPEADQAVRIHQGQRQNEGSQKRLRFHYERNSFP